MPKKSLHYIVRNSLFLYFRTIYTTLSTLVTVSLLIKAIGLIDFGLYNVVAGFVSILALFSQSMSMAVQRFFSFYLGKGSAKKVNNSFNISLLIFFILGLIIYFLGETIGLYLVKNYLNIPPDRFNASMTVYHFSLIAFIFTVFSVPFSGMIIAKENMFAYAFIGILDSSLKLIAAFILVYFSSDRLSLYGIFTATISFLILLTYNIIGFKKYDECKLNFNIDRKQIKAILGFSSWSIFGILAGIANNQGNNILINVFFNPIINASRGIAFQINSALNALSNSMFLAIRPQMIKSYAENDLDYTMKLFYTSTKFITYLLLLITFPLFFNLEFILTLWLGKTNESMILFSKLILLFNIIFALQTPITTIIHASGRLRNYHLIVESIILLSLPLTYFAFKIGAEAYTTFIISIIVFFVAHMVRLLILRRIILFSIRNYLISFLLPSLVISFVVIASIYYFLNFIDLSDKPFLNLFFSILFSTILTSILIFYYGLDAKEKLSMVRLINQFFKH